MAGRQIVVSIVGDASKYDKATKQAEGSSERLGSKLNKVAKVASVAALGGLAMIGKMGWQGIKEGEEATASFTDALSRSNTVLKGQKDQLIELSSEMQKKTKFTQEDTLSIATAIAKNESLSGVVKSGAMTATDMTKRIADMATVMKTDGAPAADALAKAMANPEKASRLLVKAGVDLTAGEEKKLKAMVESGKTADAQAFILGKLKKSTEGAAEAAGNTMAGKMERAKNSFGEVTESLTANLLPAITGLLSKGAAVSAWAEENPKLIKIVASVIGGLAIGILAISGAMKVWNATKAAAIVLQKAWNAAMKANTLTIVIIALVALGVALYTAYKKSETFRAIVNGVFNAIKNTITGSISAVRSVVSKGFDFIKNIFLNFTGPGLIIKHFDKIKAGAQTMVNGIKRAFDGVKGAISGVVNAVKSAWNNTVGGRGISIPSIGIGPFKTPGVNFSIPYLANGGVANANMPHIVGERGPELFVPGRTGRVVPNHQLGGGGGTTVIQLVLDGRVVAESVHSGLLEKQARTGSLGFRAA